MSFFLLDELEFRRKLLSLDIDRRNPIKFTCRRDNRYLYREMLPYLYLDNLELICSRDPVLSYRNMSRSLNCYRLFREISQLPSPKETELL